MLKIGEFSKVAKITIKALRYYDDIGLFKPAFVDENGYRYYDMMQLNDLIKIQELRKIDMPIDSIQSILNGGDLQDILVTHLSKLISEQEKINMNISMLNNYIINARKGDFMEKYVAKEVIIPDYNVYYRHGVIDSMAQLFDFVLEAGEEATKNNPSLECEDYCFITYAAKEYKEKNVELEYVEAVKGKVNESENIKAKFLKGGKFVQIDHKGSYEDLPKAYAFALNFIKENGYEINGDIRECYVDGCWNKADECDYLTLIQIPVK